MTDLALCVACGANEPQPIICRVCEDHLRADLAAIRHYRSMLHDWTEIDPGTPCTNHSHDHSPMLALVDSLLMTRRGTPDLTVIAMTDLRTRRIVAGWHDCECGDAECTAYRQANNLPECTDPDHRQNAADDVPNVDADLLAQARWIIEERDLDPQLRDVFDVIDLLRQHLDWAMRHPAVDEFAAAVRGCAVALRTAARAWPDPAIGTCPAAHPDRDACGGPLVFDWRGPLPINACDHTTPTHLVCKRCGDETLVDAYVWQMMRALPEHLRIPVPREWVTQTWQIPPGQLRMWVHRGHVRGYADGDVDLVDVLTRIQDTPSQATGA